MVQHKAHNEDSKPRTDDIKTDEDAYFSLMLLPEPILIGLKKCGYKKLSPIQKEALPFVKCGMDLIIQAKAGTGKTCVFTIASLELCNPELPHLQAVILAPTREIAQQITEVICAIGQACQGLKACCFVGGYALSQDQENVSNCHIAVGSPGRVRHLISMGILKTKHVRLFVLDEADKLLGTNIFLEDINTIFLSLPESKQVLACSATYTPEMVKTIQNYMHNGLYITPSQSIGDRTVLLGVRQFVGVLSYHIDKLARFELKQRYLLHLLKTIKFNQCLVFSNYHSRAMSVCNMLRAEDLSVEWIAGCQEQADRVLALSHLKEQRVRVLVTTDLTSRGIDAENVNFVINLDVPVDSETYLHRMGRAGRYGTHGMVITIIFQGEDQVKFQKLLGAIGGATQCVSYVPDNLTDIDLWEVPDSNLDKLFGIEVSSSETKNNNGEKEKEPVSIPYQENGDSQQSDKIVTPLSNGVSSYELGPCSCMLFEAQPEDIESISNFSLFSVSKKLHNWRNVLSSMEVFEHKLPLNTPVILVGTKIIRVKKWEKFDYRAYTYMKEAESGLIKFEQTNSKTKHLRFEEILEIFDDGASEDDNSDEEKSNNVDYSSEDSTNNDGGSLLQQQTSINSVLSSNELHSNDESCIFIEDILNKYETNLLSFKSFISAFEFLDIIGWMAVDENHTILNDLKTLEFDVFQFDFIECVSGKKHVVVSPPSVKSTQDNSGIDNDILTLDLKKLDLSQPFSLANIAEKLNKKKIELATINFLTHENGTAEKIKSSEPKNRHNDQWYLSKTKINTSKLYTKESTSPDPLPNGTASKKKNELSIQNSFTNKQKDKQKIVSNHSCTNLTDLSKRKTKNVLNVVNTGAGKKESRIEQLGFTLNVNKSRGKNRIRGKKASSESTEESDTSSLSVSLFKSASEMNSSESEASGPHVDMTQNLHKWQQLHNNEESDTDDNSESECYLYKFRQSKNVVVESSSGTTRSEEMLLGARRKEPSVCLPRSRKYEGKLNHQHKLQSDSDNPAQQYSYQTPRLEHYGSFGDKRSSNNRCKNRIKTQIHLHAYQANHSKLENENSHRKTCKNKIDSSRNNKPREFEFYPKNPHCSRSVRNVQTISSNNLYSEWYNKWYVSVRQKAEEIAYVEYINAMSTL